MKLKLLTLFVALGLFLAACGTAEPAPEVDAAQPTDIVLSVPTATGTPEDKTCTVTFYGAQYKLVPGQALKVDDVVVFENVDGECLDGEGNPADIVVTAPTAAASATATLASVQPEAMVGGYTSCKALEAAVIANMPGVPLDQIGSKEHPIDYTKVNGYHDLCFAWAGYGSGMKYVIIKGPAVLQIGEGCDAAGVVYLKANDPTYTYCVNGGWKYVSDSAIDAQWKLDNGKVVLESASEPYRYGQACGYKRDLKLEDVKGYRWDGSKLVVTPDLECPYTLAQLLANDFGMNASSTAVPAVTGQDWEAYPEIFKVTYQGHDYCGAKAAGVDYPTGTKVIENYPKLQHDGNYLQDGGNDGIGYKGYCKGTAPDGKAWTIVLLDAIGYHGIEIPYYRK